MSTSQQSLFDAGQQQNLSRVESRLGSAILMFCKARLRSGGRFHMEDLRKHLDGLGIPFAPASPDRILRQLRAKNVIGYRVLNRAQSLYEVTQYFLEAKQ